MNMSPLITSNPALDAAMNSNTSAASGESTKPSAAHYEAPKEPEVSPFGVIVGAAVLLAICYFIYKFVPVFEHGRKLAAF